MSFNIYSICFYFMCVGVLPTGVSVHHLHVVPMKTLVTPGIQVTNRCTAPYGCWESNPDLKEQPCS